MADASHLGTEGLNELLAYDPEAGKLHWKPRGIHWFRDFPRKPASNSMGTWNSRYAGKRAFGSVDGKGYHCGSILGKTYLAHRVIWCMVFGDWPTLVIDHINGDPRDNRICNLRHVSQAENCWNSTHVKRGIHPGVCFDPRRGRFHARLNKSGKQHFLGYFSTLQEAVSAVERARDA